MSDDYSPRQRATQYEMYQREKFLVAYAAEHGPITVRGLYYQAEVAGLPGIDKTEASYAKIQQQVLKLRRDKKLPYGHIADATRWMRKPRSFDSIEAALQNTAQTYRRDLWFDADGYVEVWCEKDALAGVIFPVTAEYDVPLMVSRGFSSETFAYEAVAARLGNPRDYHVYYFGDFDQAGYDAANSLEEKLERFAAEEVFDVYFHHTAITEQQVTELGLSTRPHKRGRTRDQGWPHPYACELDAIDPDTLREMVRDCIEQHLPREQLERLKVIEAAERDTFLEMARNFQS